MKANHDLICYGATTNNEPAKLTHRAPTVAAIISSYHEEKAAMQMPGAVVIVRIRNLPLLKPIQGGSVVTSDVERTLHI